MPAMTTTNAEPRRASRGGNGNERGSAAVRRTRRHWMLTAYRANVDALVHRDPETGAVDFLATADPAWHGTPEEPRAEHLAAGFTVELACRCYRCGHLLVDGTVTTDRIFPGVTGGKYGSPAQDRREKRTNCRPACLGCNSTTGATLASKPRKGK